ncbi:hypothetical protein [Levilactobacillus phage ENFP1]|nr:hypothetical protein [Levilactobacillus phage ENFP1]
MEETVKQVVYRSFMDNTYAKRISSLPLTEDYFSKEVIPIIKVINSHYKKDDTPISGEAINLELEKSLSENKNYSETDIKEIMSKVSDISLLSTYSNYNNDQPIKENTDSWLRKKLAMNTLTKTLSNRSLDDKDTIDYLVNDLMDISSIGEETELIDSQDLLGEDNIQPIHDAIKESITGSISLGIPELDAVMSGGLKRKELGMVVAKTGGGKTTFLLNIACNLIADKKNVVYLELEENKGTLFAKGLSMLNRRNVKDLFSNGGNELNEFAFKDIMKNIKKGSDLGRLGQFTLWTAESYKVTLEAIEKKLQKYYQDKGFYPDMLIVDYPDLLKNSYINSGVREEHASEMLIHSIRDLAKKYNMIAFVASQANRFASTQITIGEDGIEGAKAKLNPTELAISVNHNSDERSAGFTRLYIMKARNRDENFPDDGTIRLKTDKSSGRLNSESAEERKEHQKIIDEMGTAFNTNSAKTNNKMNYELTEEQLDKKRNKI